jgi:hypothetical protein
MKGLVSLPLLPLEFDVVPNAPPLSMPDLWASLSFLPDTLPFFSSGDNRLYRVVVLPRFIAAGPLWVLWCTVGGSYVPNRRWGSSCCLPAHGCEGILLC